ncbi:PA2778 family cysteine peptidase [Lysobacter olei]
MPVGIRAAAGVVLAVALSGCAIGPALRVSEAAPEGPLLLPNVPFHPQEKYQCGPAALAMVLGADGVHADPEALASQVYLPGREGSLQVELGAAMRRAGRIPYPVTPTPTALLSEVHAGRPVLVLQNLLTRSVPRWHYAVVVGADPDRNRIVLHSGTRRALATPARTFLRTWDWAGRWGLVALRPGELPATPEPVTYLTAVADYEAVAGAAAARPAYEAAHRQWPTNPRVLLAMGNLRHAAGQRETAARFYRDGLAQAPGDPVLGNNYASVLGELGCRREALGVLDAVRADDPRWAATLSQTRTEVERSKAPRQPACKAIARQPVGR